MRKLTLVAAGVVTLAAAGLAAGLGIKTHTAKLVAGTFAATTASQVETRTCTSTDGKTIAVSHGRYTGVSAGDADFVGPITLDVHSTINTTDDVGVVTGKAKIDVAPLKTTKLHFDAVYANGKLAGSARGHAAVPAVQVLANLSAGFSTAGGFTTGMLGGGTAGGAAVELSPGRCAPNHPPKEESSARGTVTQVNATSITVAGLTCTVPPSLLGQVSKLAVGDVVEIHCALVSGTNTLVKFRKLH